MTADVYSMERPMADSELRRLRKGMADHDCSMKTFVYIDRLEKAVMELGRRLDAFENHHRRVDLAS